MSVLGFAWYYVVLFLVVLTVLVYVHEFGHYWVARRNGVRVEVFSIGFGPEIYGWTDKADTRWKISAIPLGGYVKMFGQSDTGDDGEEQELTPEERAVSFAHKKLWQRAAVVFAGPAANFLFAIVVFALLAWLVGTPVPQAGVGTVVEGSPAAAAGLEPGDTIVSIDGEPTPRFTDLQQIVERSAGTPIDLSVRRGGNEVVLTAVPEPVTTEGGETIGRLGVTPDPEQVEYHRENVLSAAWLGVDRTFGMVGAILSYLGDIFTGDRGTQELGGPLRIAQLSGEMAQGGVVNLIVFMAALSVNLGLINLFPIPMLDGGHLAFYAAELVRGRPLGPRAQEYGFRFGLILVLLLMVYATWNDLEHLRVIEFFKNLVS